MHVLYLDLSIFLSLTLLFGIAANFRAMDGYTFLRSLVSLLERRVGVLYAVVIVTCIFSPVILNDVVILVLTPVLVRYAKQFQVDIAPLLVAEISFTNIASILTPFGNPQNLLLWQASGVSAGGFVKGTWVPALVSGTIAAAFLFYFSRKLGGRREFSAPLMQKLPPAYLAAVGLVVFVLDYFGVSTVLVLGIAFLIGLPFTIRAPRRLGREFDLRSLLTLFVLVGGVGVLGLVLQPYLVSYVEGVASGTQPYSALFMGVTSSLISNVPATQLVLSTSSISAQVAPKIAVEAGLAGNITPVASFANLLALLMVKRSGLPVKNAIIMQLAIGLVSFLPAFL